MANINQKAYLQKYLAGPSGDKKKKKKKAVKGTGLKIIDDDIDLSKLRPLDGDELDILDQGEDAPQIAGIIDERPEDVKKAEQFSSSSKWRVLNQDDGFNSKLQIEEIKSDIKQTEKENELIFGKMYSDSEDEKNNDSDFSPPRKQTDDNQSKHSKASKKHDSDNDFSPPRKRNDKSPNGRNNDISPKRRDNDKSPKRRSNEDRSPKREKERIRKPSRWGEFGPESEVQISKKDPSPSRKSKRRGRSRSSDASPPRKSKNHDSDTSPPRKSKKNHDLNTSPPRNSKRNYDSDQSPPRKSKKADDSPPRKHRNYDFNLSSSRIHKGDVNKRNRSPEPSSRRYSPQRQYKDKHDRRPNNKLDKSRKHRHSTDSDLSPPRKSKKPQENNKRKYNSDSDQSPPRRDKSRNIPDKDRTNRNNDSPPPSNRRMAKTLEGKLAGLQDARQLREENESFRKREEEVFNKMTDDVSGRNAQVVSRKSKRETSEDRQQQKEKVERQKELDEKYKKWSKGIKQIEDQETRVQEFLHEASKPLARLRNDRDLEENLRQVERAGDPMLKYIKDKKRERGELGPEKPMYKGQFPPNRFNIRPGYRWDGVDRSNGYENKYFDQQSKRKAQEEEAYKWSTEDL